MSKSIFTSPIGHIDVQRSFEQAVWDVNCVLQRAISITIDSSASARQTQQEYTDKLVEALACPLILDPINLITYYTHPRKLLL